MLHHALASRSVEYFSGGLPRDDAPHEHILRQQQRVPDDLTLPAAVRMLQYAQLCHRRGETLLASRAFRRRNHVG